MSTPTPDQYSDIKDLAQQSARFLPFREGDLTDEAIEDMLQKYWNNSAALWIISGSLLLPDFVRTVILRRKKSIDLRADIIRWLIIGAVGAIILFIVNSK